MMTNKKKCAKRIRKNLLNRNRLLFNNYFQIFAFGHPVLSRIVIFCSLSFSIYLIVPRHCRDSAVAVITGQIYTNVNISRYFLITEWRNSVEDKISYNFVINNKNKISRKKRFSNIFRNHFVTNSYKYFISETIKVFGYIRVCDRVFVVLVLVFVEISDKNAPRHVTLVYNTFIYKIVVFVI